MRFSFFFLVSILFELASLYYNNIIIGPEDYRWNNRFNDPSSVSPTTSPLSCILLSLFYSTNLCPSLLVSRLLLVCPHLLVFPLVARDYRPFCFFRLWRLIPSASVSLVRTSLHKIHPGRWL